MSLDSRSVPGVLPANFSKQFFETQAAKIDPIWYGLHSNVSKVVADVYLGREQNFLVRLLNSFISVRVTQHRLIIKITVMIVLFLSLGKLYLLVGLYHGIHTGCF